MGDLDKAKDICSKCSCIQDWNTMKPDEDINNFNIYCDNCYENKIDTYRHAIKSLRGKDAQR